MLNAYGVDTLNKHPAGNNGFALPLYAIVVS